MSATFCLGENEAFVFWALGSLIGGPVGVNYDYEIAVVVGNFLRERGQGIGRNR